MTRRSVTKWLGITAAFVGLTAVLFALRGLSPPSADSEELSIIWVPFPKWLWYVRWPLSMLMAQAIHRTLGWTGADSLALMSSMAGALFFITVGLIARRSPLLLIVFASSVTLTLIGHVEVYAWPSLFLLWLLLMGPLHLKGRLPLAPIATAFVFGCLFHMLMVVYFPALVWLALRGRKLALSRGDDRKHLDADMVQALLRLVLLFVAVAVGPLIFLGAGLDNGLERVTPLFTPEVPISSNQVTLLSPTHLFQMLGFLAISCPVGLILVGIRFRRAFANDTVRFTSIAAVCGLAFLVLWHPDMGWRGDWDLFSHPGLVINVLAWRLWSEKIWTRRNLSILEPRQE